MEQVVAPDAVEAVADSASSAAVVAWSAVNPSSEPTFGWFENDVCTGLLMIALYLGVLQLRRVASTLIGRRTRGPP
jgi:hypothetical protein